ncbi:MAG TPA: phosphatase domain-containing protein [Gammaproteobacteria bacterium]
MKRSLRRIFFILLCALIFTPVLKAESWLEEGFREIEELRLRQLQTVQKENDIKPFTTDGCSGFQSQNWELLAKTLSGFEKQFGDKPPWESCCVTHDKVYWRGSVVEGYQKRKHADEGLRKCVVNTGEKLASQLSVKYSVSEDSIRQVFSITADLMYQAVRLGGQPCSLLPWRWGYGWASCAFVAGSDLPEHYSDVKPDEHVTLFNTAAWLDEDNAYWHIPIHAWIYEPEDSVVRSGIFEEILESSYDLKITPETEQNFHQRINLLIADNERGKKLVIRIAGRDFTLPLSKENGHVVTELKLSAELVNAFSEQGRLHYFVVTSAEDTRRFEGDVQLVSRYGISVISDIDDTIKISNVTDHKQLFDNTFFKDFQAVSDMPELYRWLVEQNAVIHFVSSSPWQLYEPLQAFTHKAGFPWASMSLKDVRFRDETVFNLFKKGTETKPLQIEPVLQRHAGRQFILVGDSGEQDPEVYGDIARRYPSQVKRILIRNVDGSSAEDERYKLAFKNVHRNKWQLFDQPVEIDVGELLNSK